MTNILTITNYITSHLTFFIFYFLGCEDKIVIENMPRGHKPVYNQEKEKKKENKIQKKKRRSHNPATKTKTNQTQPLKNLSTCHFHKMSFLNI